MGTEQTTFQISREKLFALVNPAFSTAGSGGGGTQPNPDEPLKPGPWDPVIRAALKEVLRFGPQPDPWRLGPGPQPWRAGPVPDPWTTSLLSSGLLGVIARRF